MLEEAKVSLRRLLRPLVRRLEALGVHPDQLTVAGLIASLFCGAATAAGRLGVALAWLAVALLCDLLDGDLARMRGQGASRFGAFLDSSSDRVAEALVFGGLLIGRASHGEGLSWPWILAWLLSLTGSFMVSYTRARAEGLGITCRVGIADRAARMVLVIAILIFGFGTSLWFLIALALASWITVIQRGALVWRETRADAKVVATPDVAPADADKS